MSWWNRSTGTSAQTLPEGHPLIRLEGIGRVFEGDADEPAVALRDVSVDIGRGELCVGVGAVGLRQVDVSGDSGAARLANRPADTG